MPISDAKLAANRRNARRSTGPKTPEGKERSRRNALKHGLTGQGVALPSEDQVEITRRFTAFQDELAPSNELAEQLVRRVAFLSVRLERSEKHETAVVAKRVRHAIAEFDDARLHAVEGLAYQINHDPDTTSRRLQATPEGIDWLLKEWQILRGDLLNTERDCWTSNHRAMFDSLLGRNPGSYRMARIMALSHALGGSFYHLDKADGEGLEGPARAEWARGELKRLIDVEVERLKEVRIGLDSEELARDRAEAVDRALFDPSKEMVLARKYEAATERGLYRALKELRQVEAEAAEGIARDANPDVAEDSESVGSNLPEPTPEPTAVEPRPSIEPRSFDFDLSSASVLDFSVGKAPEFDPKAVKTAGQDVA